VLLLHQKIATCGQYFLQKPGDTLSNKLTFSFVKILAKVNTCLKAFFMHRQVEAEAKEHGLDREQ
jgi:hypothetical protein